MTPALRLWLSVGGLIALAAACQLAGLEPWLRYSRDAVAAGQVWRLISAHLVHLGPAHLALNATGVLLVAALVGAHLRPSGWAASWLASALAISAGLWWLHPEIGWYVGLSGVLHGLIVTGAMAALDDRRERLFALVVLAAIGAKLGWEQVSGAMPGTAGLAGGPVVTEAHLYGAVGGLLAGAVALAARRRGGRRRETG